MTPMAVAVRAALVAAALAAQASGYVPPPWWHLRLAGESQVQMRSPRMWVGAGSTVPSVPWETWMPVGHLTPEREVH